MKKIVCLMVVALALAGCGAEWAVCETCRPGEQSAQSADGGQIPIVVQVNVDVDVNQSQNQGQSQSQSQGGTCTTCPASTPDAGKPVVDAGTPPKPDAGCPPVCRQVCVETKQVYTCGHHHHHCGSCSHHTVCVKEVTQCS